MAQGSPAYIRRTRVEYGLGEDRNRVLIRLRLLDIKTGKLEKFDRKASNRAAKIEIHKDKTNRVLQALLKWNSKNDRLGLPSHHSLFQSGHSEGEVRDGQRDLCVDNF